MYCKTPAAFWPRANDHDILLITTDGFELYGRVIEQVFGPACIYGQVLKTRRSNRVIKVERRAVMETEERFAERCLSYLFEPG